MKVRAFILLIILLHSCSAEEAGESIENDFGYDYFPLLDIGDFREYEIDQTTYSNEGKNITTSHFFIKEEVVESVGKQSETASYRIDVFVRESENDDWNYIRTTLIEFNALQAIVHEAGERIIHLNFPTRVGKEWNGLSLIDASRVKNLGGESIAFYKGWSFEITDRLNSFGDYIDVLEVQQADSENLIERRYSIEKYARGIGLIFKEQMILDTQCLAECEGMRWEEKAHKGIVLTKKLIHYN